MTHLPSDNLGRAIQAFYPGRVEVVSVTGTHAETTNGFLDGTTVVRLACDVGCHYTVGTPPVDATTSDSWLPVGVVEYINVSRGQMISFIREGGSSGTAWVTEGL